MADDSLVNHSRKQANGVLTASIISIILLLVAVPAGLPYGYYVFLRWVITATSAYVAWASYESEKLSWTWIFGLVGLLFNPIVPIYLNKETWVIIDFVAAGLFVAAGFSFRGTATR